MNKKAYLCIIIVLVFLLLITGTYTIVHYYFDDLADEWFRESINNGDYEIVGYEIRDGIFDGAAQVEISIFDDINKVHMVTFHTSVRNQGKKLTDDNYDIECTKEYIKIALINADGQTKAYRFFFEDFKYGEVKS